MVQLRQVQETDPVNDIANRQLAEVYLYRRQYDQAILHFARMSRPPVFQLAVAYTGKGKGLDEIRNVREPWESAPNYPVALAYACAAANHEAEALRLLEEYSKEPPHTVRFQPNVRMAAVNARLGRNDQAFNRLHEAHRAGEWYLFRLKVDPVFDPLRSDPRFEALLRRLGLGP